jgi:hypothetical protein
METSSSDRGVSFFSSLTRCSIGRGLSGAPWLPASSSSGDRSHIPAKKMFAWQQRIIIFAGSEHHPPVQIRFFQLFSLALLYRGRQFRCAASGIIRKKNSLRAFVIAPGISVLSDHGCATALHFHPITFSCGRSTK